MSPSELFEPRLTITTHRSGEEIRVRLVGELDIGNAAEFEETLMAAEAAHAGCIRVDLSELEFLDSAGLRAILSAQLRAAVGGDTLVLVPGPERVQRLFAMTGTADLLHFEDDQEPPDNVRELPGRRFGAHR
jgi:anti-sigma B factor antagonist